MQHGDGTRQISQKSFKSFGDASYSVVSYTPMISTRDKAEPYELNVKEAPCNACQRRSTVTVARQDTYDLVGGLTGGS